MRTRPFREGDTFATFRALLENTVREIDSLENEYVLKASPTELEDYYVSKVTVTPLSLDADNHYIKGQKGTQLDVSHHVDRVVFPGERAIVKGTTLHIAILYSGDPNLWRIRPSTFSLSGYPELEIRDDVVVFTCTFPDDSANPERLKAEIQNNIRYLADAVANLRRDVDNHNRTASQTIRSALAQKRTKAQSAVGAVAALGIPIKKRSQPLTFTVPTKRRESPVKRPLAATEKYAPEPALDQNEYEHILGVLKSMSLVIERNPGAFASLDEEAIRTHFLLQLNGHYEGTATGETLNAAGKTDILIRAENRNIFIAECKFWHGPKSFTDAVDQLLGYLSWRDSKSALLIFNQTRDSTAVRQKMREIMTSRPEYRKTLEHDPAGRSRYIFVKTTDPGREIQICIMLFDVPTA
ncbi:hypothetical protein [Acidithiobacillus sp. AMEEHan]|uniref:hypothetical protein n=1 Tax=Acidithiobacillus sp. AMEEHan TaxID=2994951 RepID=UPI0027E3FFF3|nr:hypothetical protein [Acidithiobacillus sp. AMEEHan]